MAKAPVEISLKITATPISSSVLDALGPKKINRIFYEEVLTPSLEAIKRRTPGKKGIFREHWKIQEYQKSKSGLLQKVRIRFDEDNKIRKVKALAALEAGTKAYTIRSNKPSRTKGSRFRYLMFNGAKGLMFRKTVSHPPHRAFHMIGETKKELPDRVKAFKARVDQELTQLVERGEKIRQTKSLGFELIERAGRVFTILRDALGRFAKRFTD